MSDRIMLRGLSVRACHGVLDAEKVAPQPFLADVELECDTRRAGESDDLAWTINYAEVAGAAHAILTGPTVELIETLAERVAAMALENLAVEAATVTIYKPQAPAGVPFHDQIFGGPAVTVRRAHDWPFVVAIGANLGRTAETLTSAVRMLAAVEGVELVSVGPLVETDPVGGPEQPNYLNSVIIGRTQLTPWTLLDQLHRIESAHGRTREIHWGARTLDLDLIQFGDPGSGTHVISEVPELQLPHPWAAERAFVLAPWAAAAPAATMLTADGVTPVAELLEHVGSQGVRPGPQWSPL